MLLRLDSLAAVTILEFLKHTLCTRTNPTPFSSPPQRRRRSRNLPFHCMYHGRRPRDIFAEVESSHHVTNVPRTRRTVLGLLAAIRLLGRINEVRHAMSDRCARSTEFRWTRGEIGHVGCIRVVFLWCVDAVLLGRTILLHLLMRRPIHIATHTCILLTHNLTHRNLTRVIKPILPNLKMILRRTHSPRTTIILLSCIHRLAPLLRVLFLHWTPPPPISFRRTKRNLRLHSLLRTHPNLPQKPLLQRRKSYSYSLRRYTRILLNSLALRPSCC